MPENIGYQFNRLYAAPIETYRQVNTITQRNAIPPEIRWEGMACYVVTENQDYQLVGGVDNSNWVNAGETVSNPTTHFKGFFNATTVTPALSNLNGIEGDEYKVTNGGVNVDFGSGPIFLKTDDIIIFYQSEWMVKVSDSDAATSWGDIEGDIADQSDLQGALDLKADVTDLLPLYFPLNSAYRGWQGVVADENYVYTFTDRNASFGLENIIQRYNHNGNFVDEKLNAYTGLDTLGNFMSFGSGYVDDNYVMATVSNSNSPNPDKESKVVRLNKNDLSFIADFDIGADSSSGLAYYNGNYYVSYHDLMVVRKFDSSFNFIEEFSLSRPLETYGGYQSIFFKDGFAFFNYHGANSYGSDYAFGVDKYSFDGSDFTFVENITPPTYGSGQQVSYGNGLYYWADRVENKIIITPSIYQTQKNLISPSLMGLNITVEGEDNPRRILEVDNYADHIGTANVFAFRKARGTKYNPTALIANSLIGGLSFRGHDGTDFNSTSGGVYVHAAENFSNVAHGTYLTLVTTPIGTTSPLEGARLNPNGNFVLNRGNSIVLNGLGGKHRSENTSGGYIEVGVTSNATSRGFINFTNGLDIGGNINVAGKGSFTGTAIAAPATLSTELVTKGQLDAAARPYKVYTALISQSGTSAPTAKVLENTLGFVPTFGYTSTGVFTVNSSGGFTSDKTYISFTIRNGSITNWIGDHSWSSSSALQITSKNSGVLTNGFPSDAELEIRVYP